MTTRRLALVLLTLFLAWPQPANTGTAEPSTWIFDLDAAARASVVTDLSQVRPAARPFLHRLEGRVAFDSDTRRCHDGAASCSYPHQGASRRWGIHLDAQTTSATYPSNRFLVYHELGHSVWGLLLDDAQRRAFATAVGTALDGQPCLNGLGKPCADLQELFADEFARWAGGFANSMSFYWTPALLDADTFAAVVNVA